MTEPIKPKRRVTAQIPITSSPKLATHSTPSPSPAGSSSRPAIRARVDPSSVSGSSTPTSRPSLRSSQSSASIRSSASSPSVPTLHAISSRPRSPVRIKSPLPPISSSASGSPAVVGGTRARVRAASPGGLTSPLNQSYAQSSGGGTPGTSGERVRARATNIVTVGGGNGGRPKGFPSEPSGTQEPAGRAKAKAPSHQPLASNPSEGSRRSSVVSASSSALSKAVSSPLQSPVPIPPISPQHLQHLQTPGAGPSERRRSLSPVRRIQGQDAGIPSAAPLQRPYPLTPTLAPVSGVTTRFSQDPMASCPPSPHHSALPPSVATAKINGYARRLPEHPHASRPPLLPPPREPELRIVDLPPLPPAVLPEGGLDVLHDGNEHVVGLGLEGGVEPRSGLGIALGLDDGGVSREVVEPDAGAGAGGAVGVSTAGADKETGSVGNQSLEPMDPEGGDSIQLDGVVEEARINRKVADLEISNASLLAINRSLEISKSKQRAEILRLRRALRESLAGPILPSGPSSSSYFPTSTPRPYPSSPFSRMFETPYLDPDAEEDEEEPGLEADLEQRWAKLEDVMGTMQKRAEVAVRAVAEETRPAGRAVLGGWEDEEVEGEGTGTGGIGTPERQGEG